MRVLILTGLCLAMLAACSQKSDREMLTEACIADGEGPLRSAARSAMSRISWNP